ncbi:MAG: metallophosphoesterase [Deltaproteobacteria bacterium]|nr:metallophosphoesterase [Deltaproteobacteria bacterium]MBW2444902.1 metallophosphoesterase [Deltaproteobacteria bacterium]
MRIGVVSDTHNHLPNVARIVALFREARVERVIHTGDITQPKTLDAFAALDVPLVAVYGNNDAERSGLEAAASRHGMELCEPPLELHWAGRCILVVHDPLELDLHLARHHDVALHGHDHQHVVDQRGETLVFNPGECAGHMPGRNAVGVLDLARLEAELLRF